jgi:uncharacterized membrane protein YkvA (DUF1232 family)
MNIKERAKKLKSYIPAVFLCLKDGDTPKTAKIFAVITVFYALSPIDLIPDFIPVLGYIDDIILLPVLIAVTIKLIPKNVLERNLILSDKIYKNGIPKKFRYGIPIILIWILIILLIFMFFLKID